VSAQLETILEEEIVKAIATATSVVRGAAIAVVTTVVTSAVLGAATEILRRKANIVVAVL
jgi:hypothetical protein